MLTSVRQSSCGFDEAFAIAFHSLNGRIWYSSQSPAVPKPRRSRRVIGQSVVYDARPASDSLIFFIASRFADPVKTNCPGVRRGWLSTYSLRLRISSGSRCTSSITRCGERARRPAGSATACSRMSELSSVTYGYLPNTGWLRTRVLFPVWRAPMTTTTGITAAAYVRCLAAARGRIEGSGGVRRLAMDIRERWRIIHRVMVDYPPDNGG